MTILATAAVLAGFGLVSGCDFVPCVSATEGAGLWDCAEGKFYPNNGGTAFNTP